MKHFTSLSIAILFSFGLFAEDEYNEPDYDVYERIDYQAPHISFYLAGTISPYLPGENLDKVCIYDFSSAERFRYKPVHKEWQLYSSYPYTDYNNDTIESYWVGNTHYVTVNKWEMTFTTETTYDNTRTYILRKKSEAGEGKSDTEYFYTNGVLDSTTMAEYRWVETGEAEGGMHWVYSAKKITALGDDDVIETRYFKGVSQEAYTEQEQTYTYKTGDHTDSTIQYVGNPTDDYHSVYTYKYNDLGQITYSETLQYSPDTTIGHKSIYTHFNIFEDFEGTKQYKTKSQQRFELLNEEWHLTFDYEITADNHIIKSDMYQYNTLSQLFELYTTRETISLSNGDIVYLNKRNVFDQWVVTDSTHTDSNDRLLSRDIIQVSIAADSYFTSKTQMDRYYYADRHDFSSIDDIADEITLLESITTDYDISFDINSIYVKYRFAGSEPYIYSILFSEVGSTSTVRFNTSFDNIGEDRIVETIQISNREGTTYMSTSLSYDYNIQDFKEDYFNKSTHDTIYDIGKTTVISTYYDSNTPTPSHYDSTIITSQEIIKYGGSNYLGFEMFNHDPFNIMGQSFNEEIEYIKAPINEYGFISEVQVKTVTSPEPFIWSQFDYETDTEGNLLSYTQLVQTWDEWYEDFEMGESWPNTEGTYSLQPYEKVEYSNDFDLHSCDVMPKVVYTGTELYEGVTPHIANKDNIITKGKPLRFKVKVQNNYSENLLTLKAKIRSVNPHITITDSLGNYNNILTGASALTNDEFEIIVHDDIPNNTTARFELRIEDEILQNEAWLSYFEIPLTVFTVPLVVIDDDSNPDSQGNDNDIAEPSETIEIIPLLENTTALEFQSVTGELQARSFYINIWDGKAGASGTVSATQDYNISSNQQSPVTAYQSNISPREDFVFDHTGDSIYSLQFQINVSAQYDETLYKWAVPFAMNDGYPFKLEVAVDETTLSNIEQGETITLSPEFSNSDAVQSVTVYVDGALVETTTAYPFSTEVETAELSAGAHTVKLVITDAQGNETIQTHPLTIEGETNAGNKKPVVQKQVEDIRTTLEANPTVIGIRPIFSDPEASVLQYAVQSSDEAVAQLTLTTEALSISPLAIGSTTITLTATDDQGASSSIQFSYSVVDPSNSIPSAIGTLQDISILEGDGKTFIDLDDFEPLFVDNDGDALSYSVGSSDATIAQVSLSGTVIIVEEVGTGSTTITLTASDGKGGLASIEFDYTIVAGLENQAPEVIAEATSIEESVIDTYELDLNTYFQDPEGSALTYSVEINDNAPASVTNTNATLSVQANDFGSSLITVTATDPEGLSTAFSFYFSVIKAGNSAPTVAFQLPNITTEEAKVYIDLDDYPELFTDQDGDELTLSVITSDESVATVKLTGSVIVITKQAQGNATVSIVAQDGNGGLSENTFTISIEETTTAINATEWKISLAPNPVKDYVQISHTLQAEYITVQVINLQGVVVFTEKLHSQNNTISVDLSSLATGVYSLSIASELQKSTTVLFKE